MTTNDEKEIWIFLSHSNKDFAKVRFASLRGKSII